MKPNPPRPVVAFLKLFFYHFYRSLSWSYDIVAWIVSGGRWNDWVKSCLPFIQGPDVLELGYGPGHLQVAMVGKGWNVYGIDESPQMTKHALRRVVSASETRDRQVNKVNPSNLAQASAMAAPFMNEVFTSVVSTFPTQYIYQPQTLSEIYRILKPGGRMIIIPTAWITDDRILHRLLSWLFRFTGESQEWDAKLNQPFTDAGFELTSRWLHVRKSRVLLITGIKPVEPGEQTNSEKHMMID